MADINYEFQVACNNVATGSAESWTTQVERLRTIDVQGQLAPSNFLLLEVVGRVRQGMKDDALAVASSYATAGGRREDLESLLLAAPEARSPNYNTFVQDLLKSVYAPKKRRRKAAPDVGAPTKGAPSSAAKLALLLSVVAALTMVGVLAYAGSDRNWGGAMSPGQVVARYQTAIPYIAQADGSHGSGFLIEHNARLWVVTNLHVVMPVTREAIESPEVELFFLELEEGVAGYRIRFKLPITSFRRHPTLDIAVADITSYRPEFEKWNVPPLPMRTIGDGILGEEIYVIGHPGTPREEVNRLTHLTVTRGIVSGYRRIGEARILQTDAAVNPGNSGGPVIDKSGQVLALTTFGLNDASFEGDGFAIASSHIPDAIERGMPLDTKGGIAAFDVQANAIERFWSDVRWNLMSWVVAVLAAIVGLCGVAIGARTYFQGDPGRSLAIAAMLVGGLTVIGLLPLSWWL